MHAVRLEEMAILTPYSAQRDEIRKLAVEYKLLKEIAGGSPSGIKVASITESQGNAPVYEDSSCISDDSLIVNSERAGLCCC